ncbi:MAG: hypothetical protein HC871_17340 [Rhizobiales bacterium]|nr:hypothetical protein [Hyphomicrobiales bacterium]
MARIADQEIERLKVEVSLVRLVEASGVKLSRKGKDELTGCCPFHEDDTPSLSVNVPKNLFRCVRLNDAGGGVIDWTSAGRGGELPPCGGTAARRRCAGTCGYVAQRAGIALASIAFDGDQAADHLSRRRCQAAGRGGGLLHPHLEGGPGGAGLSHQTGAGASRADRRRCRRLAGRGGAAHGPPQDSPSGRAAGRRDRRHPDAANALSSLASQSDVVGAQIERAGDVAELAEASESVTRLIVQLHDAGTKVGFVTCLASDLNARIAARLWSQLAPEELVRRSCLVLMGSEGRHEQILKTDQDNGLIVADGPVPPELADVARRFTDGMIACGFPACPGEVMSAQPGLDQAARRVEGLDPRVDQRAVRAGADGRGNLL